MTTALHVVAAGNGTPLLMIHGSAADHTTWMMQLGSPTLKARFHLIAYDRRGYGRSEVTAPLSEAPTVEEHTKDALDVLQQTLRQASPAGSLPLLVGSSFGAVVALDVARRFGHLLGGLVLIEPPMVSSDDVPPIPVGFLQQFDLLVESKGGPAAGEFFLRTVLGDAAFDRIPKLFAQRSAAMFAQIRADSEALGCYKPRFHELSSMQLPTLLLGGERSAAYFQHTLSTLESVLPNAKRITVAHAGHMLHAEASKKFAEILTTFADSLVS
jgi:3-oxoadipate enol-lactonase